MQTGRKILNLRCDRRVSQQELARACSITPSALSKIEAGINSPRANVLWRIAKNLGVTVEYLLDEEMPYPYAGYSYRQAFLSSNDDPSLLVRMDVTKEEKAFLEAMRKTNQVARDIALAIPEASVETVRLVHFLVNHSKIQNPSQSFLKTFEALVTSGRTEGVPEAGTALPAALSEVPATTARKTPAAAPAAKGRAKARAAKKPARTRSGR